MRIAVVAAIALVLAGVVAAPGRASAQPASAAAAYCPNAAHGRPGKVPAALVPAVAAAFHVDGAALANAAYVRCLGATLMACYVGANLDCDKANTRRALPGATAWCRDHPGASDIPMVATGHDTIYAWSCNGKRAVAGKTLVTVDPQGYIADNWKEIH